MRKLIVSICIVSFLSVQFVAPAFAAGYGTGMLHETTTGGAAAGSSAEAAATSLPKTDKDAKPTQVPSRDGIDYSDHAGNKAAAADMAVDALPATISAIAAVGNIITWLAIGLGLQTTKQTTGLFLLFSWFPLYIDVDIVGTLITFAHAMINKYLRDATVITASFTGTEGFVTDKWVGPHPRNKVIDTMGDVSVTSKKFNSLKFDKDEYGKLQDADKASARQLQEYREEELIEDQRSLANVADAQWQKLYQAQQHCIKGLASAYELKDQLSKLGSAESGISENYDNKPGALNTLASRRALYDALLLLKINVMAARTKLRAHILELDFKPKTKENEEEETKTPEGSGVSGRGGS